MKSRSQTYLFIWLLLAAGGTVALACPPDCGDCMYAYWNGSFWECLLEGDCVDYWDCPNWGYCCDCDDCWCEDNVYWCDTCEFCENCECTCVRVTAISDPADHYCVDANDTFTATTDYDLPAGCSITWTAFPSGVVTFSGQNGTSVAATFNDAREDVQIGARTSCSPSYTWSSSFDVVEMNAVIGSTEAQDICISVVFYGYTNPLGYQDDVAWSAPDGIPSTGEGSDFTTMWRCIGDKTVTGTYCGQDANDTVMIGLPSGCREGQECATFDYTLSTAGCPDCSDANFCACWGFTGTPTGTADAIYDDCNWVWDVNVVIPVQYGTCPGHFEDICDVNDLSDPNNPTYVEDVIEGLMAGGCGGGYTIDCSDCLMEHEAVHHQAFVDYLNSNQADFFDKSALDPIPVDCSDPNTISCSAVEAKYQDAVDLEIWLYYAAARDAAHEAEPQADAVSAACDQAVAEALCEYACGKGWSIDDCTCP